MLGVGRRREEEEEEGKGEEDGELVASHQTQAHTQTHMHSLIPGDKDNPRSSASRSAEEQVGSVVASFLPLQPAAAPSLVLWQEAEDNDDDQNKRGTANGGSSRNNGDKAAPLLSVGVASMYVRDWNFF